MVVQRYCGVVVSSLQFSDGYRYINYISSALLSHQFPAPASFRTEKRAEKRTENRTEKRTVRERVPGTYTRNGKVDEYQEGETSEYRDDVYLLVLK